MHLSTEKKLQMTTYYKI